MRKAQERGWAATAIVAIGLLVAPGACIGVLAQSEKDEPEECQETSKDKAAEQCPDSSSRGASSIATPGLDLHLEYRKRIAAAQEIAPLDFGMFGEQVSLYNGATEFSIHDIEIPGNAKDLPLRLSRKLAIDLQPQGGFAFYDSRLLGAGNWDIDVPYLVATYPTASGWLNCSTGLTPTVPLTFQTGEVWQGIQVNVPGESNRRMLSMLPSTPKPAGSATYRYTTAQRDVFECIPLTGGGEGLRMTTTNGVRYYFTVQAIRTAALIRKRDWIVDPVGGNISYTTIGRSRYYMLASKIEDRHGNTVEYAYNSSGHPARIWANDGREILVTYTSGRISSAVSNGRTWQYQYVASGSEYNLSKVIQPDASEWKYTYNGSLKPPAFSASETELNSYCDLDPPSITASYKLTATHPAGAIGQFYFSNRRHWRSGVAHSECTVEGIPPDQLVWNLSTPHFFDIMSLMSKTVTGPGIPAALVWDYDYWATDSLQGLFGDISLPTTYPCTTCDTEKTVVVTHPDGHSVHHRFGIQYWANEGRELGSQVRDAGNAIQKTDTITYLSDSAIDAQAFDGDFGAGMSDGSDPGSTRVRPVVQRITNQQGRDFIWEVKSGTGCPSSAYCFDTYARPTRITTRSTP